MSGAGTSCGKATPWALPGCIYRSDYPVEGIWKPWGLLCLFRTGLPNAEEISLCSTNFPLVANTGLILPVLLARAWAARAGPGDDPLIMDLNSTVCNTFGLAQGGAAP